MLLHQDALWGYWQVPLAPESQLLTTFITPWGRHKYLRSPMGLRSAGDEYDRRGDVALSGIEQNEKAMTIPWLGIVTLALMCNASVPSSCDAESMESL